MIAAKQARIFTAAAQRQTQTQPPPPPSLPNNTNIKNQHHQHQHKHQSSAGQVEIATDLSPSLVNNKFKNQHETRSEKKREESVAMQHKQQDQEHQQACCTEIASKQQYRDPAPNDCANLSQKQQLMVRKQQLNVGQHLPTTATATPTLAASSKIQQRQQKFLAAAARSATSPSSPSSSPSSSVVASMAAAAAAAADTTSSTSTSNAGGSNRLLQSRAPGAVILSQTQARSQATQDSHQIHHQQQPKHQQQQNHNSQTLPLKPNIESCCGRAAACDSSLSPSPVAPIQSPQSNNSTPALWQNPPSTPKQQQQAATSLPAIDTTTQQRQQSHLTATHTLQRHHQINNFNPNNNNNNYHYHHHLQPQHQLSSHLPKQLQHQHSHQQNQLTTPNSISQHQSIFQHQYQQHHDQQHQQNNMDHYKFHNDCQSSVLTYEQVKRLDFVMDQAVPIHGRGNFPTLYVKLKELIRLVKYKLQKEHMIEIRDVILNGGAASYVLAPENSHYNDLDLIFGTDLSDESQFDVIRDVVLECLKEFFPHEHHNIDETPKDNDIEVKEEVFNEYTGNKSNHHKMGRLTGATVSKGRFEDLRVECSTLNPHGDGLIPPKKDKKERHSGESDEIVDEGNENLARTGSGNISAIPQTLKTVQSTNAKRTNTKADIVPTSSSSPPVMPASSLQYHHQTSYQMPLSSCAIKEAYVHKMVKVNDDDRWSLISLGVQQSEGNCCSQMSNCQPALTTAQSASIRQQQPPNRQFSVTLTYENEPNGLNNQSTGPMGMTENYNVKTIVSNNMQHHQVTYLHHQHKNQRNHYQQHQKQFPNSIELKFVDRMRRKFEFSVDSFQIILDSLIQFYDYAPQSTISKLINSHPSSTMINTRPSINKRRCSECFTGRQTIDNSNSLSRGSIINNKENFSYHSHHTTNSTTENCISGTRSLMNGTRSYYQLPVDPANSSSISSMASSSGCSSSSSVVSSSSSSLSCDEDQEDLYCDAEGPPSSSASTSSLLSSTTMSLLSSDGNSNANDIEQQKSKLLHRQQEQSNLKGIIRKIDSNGHRLKSLANNSNDYKLEPIDCIECYDKQERMNLSDHDFDLDFGSCAVISENFYPTVIGRSEYGNFKEALYHLEKKLIATRSPEEIRGGGLLKYCNLLVKNYKPTNVYQIRTLERYMCSRFFIDFSDLNQQQAKLESYLANHFSDDPMLKFDYLTILHNVVQRSTVCLMNHELRLTLNMIRDLAYKLNEQQQNHNQYQHQHHHPQQLQHTQAIFSRK